MAEQKLENPVKYVQAAEEVRSDLPATSRPLFTSEELERLPKAIDGGERAIDPR